MIFVCLFIKILKRIQSFWTLLHFIKDNQIFFRKNFIASNCAENLYNSMRLFIYLKNFTEAFFLVKRKIESLLILAPAEFFHKPGFTNLTGAF